MNSVFYISTAVAILATLMVVSRSNVVHALLYLIVSFFAVALIFFTLGAPYVAALEVIIYAGAIMVLFVFVIMMLNLGTSSNIQESDWLKHRVWIGPSLLAGFLVLELIYLIIFTSAQLSPTSSVEISPKQVGIALFGPYAVGVELASMLLLAGLVSAYHLGARRSQVLSSRIEDKP